MGDALCKCGHPRDDHYRLAVFGCRYVDEKGKYPCCCRSFSPVVGEAGRDDRKIQSNTHSGSPEVSGLVVEVSGAEVSHTGTDPGAERGQTGKCGEIPALEKPVSNSPSAPLTSPVERRLTLARIREVLSWGCLDTGGEFAWPSPGHCAYCDACVGLDALTTSASGATGNDPVPSSSDVSSETRECANCDHDESRHNHNGCIGFVNEDGNIRSCRCDHFARPIVAPSVVTERQEEREREIGGDRGRSPVVEQRSKACVLCGRDPAAGFATINGERYCHGDVDPEPTCYMEATYIQAISGGQPSPVGAEEQRKTMGVVSLDDLRPIGNSRVLGKVLAKSALGGSVSVQVAAVHTHDCRYWRQGKSHGPCLCGALTEWETFLAPATWIEEA